MRSHVPMHDASQRIFLDAEREKEHLEEAQGPGQEMRARTAAPVPADSAQEDARAGRADASATEGQALRGRVLLVEDERATQRLYSLHLRRAGAEVDVADD